MDKKLNCILLIDDDEPTNFLNRMTVEQTACTHHVAVAQGGEQALDILMGRSSSSGPDCSHPDMIFLDINMPAMDGWEFLERYQQLPEEKKASIILIMLTTSLNPDDQRRAEAIPEIAGFENKPLKEPQLQRLLKKYFPANF